MNKEKMQSWELRLGLPHVVALIGILTGTMACAFGIGYVTGQNVGFENALASSVSSLPKYPIADSTVGELGHEEVEQVYAKLQNDPFEDQESQNEPEDLPALGSIKDSESKPVVDDLVVDLLNEEAEQESKELEKAKVLEEEKLLGFGSVKEDVKIRVLDGSNEEKTATLGSIKAKSDSNTADDVEAKAPETEIAKIAKIKQESKEIAVSEKVKEQLATETSNISAESEKSTVVVKNMPQSPETQKPQETQRQPASSYLKLDLTRGWYAQVAAPKDLADADSLARKLRGSGFPVAIEQAQVRGDMYYRVLVGPEENRPQGEILLNQVKRERYLSGQPFIRMIK